MGSASCSPACFGEVRKANQVVFRLFGYFPPPANPADSAGEKPLCEAPPRPLFCSVLSEGGTGSSSPARARSRHPVTWNCFLQGLMLAVGISDASPPCRPLPSFAAVPFGSWMGFCFNKPSPVLVPPFPQPKIYPLERHQLRFGSWLPTGLLGKLETPALVIIKPRGWFSLLLLSPADELWGQARERPESSRGGFSGSGRVRGAHPACESLSRSGCPPANLNLAQPGNYLPSPKVGISALAPSLCHLSRPPLLLSDPGAGTPRLVTQSGCRG